MYSLCYTVGVKDILISAIVRRHGEKKFCLDMQHKLPNIITYSLYYCINTGHKEMLCTSHNTTLKGLKQNQYRI